MTRLGELGRLVAEGQDVVRAAHVPDPKAAETFAQQIGRGAHRRKLRVGPALGAVVVTAAAAAAVVGVIRFQRAASVGTDAPTAAVGERVVTQPGQQVPLRFPDGSEAVIGSGTEAVVHELGPTGAKVEVARGRASFAVRHQERTNWLVGAGPYHVRVTGTRFSVSWTPAPERFELRLEQGSVVVTTDTGAHAAVTMIAPQSLTIDQHGWALGAETRAATAAAVAPEAPAPAAAPPGVTSAPARAAARPATAPKWEHLARAGRYSDAYDDAARFGIASLADTRPSHALLALAEVCRFSAHAPEAARVLSKLRARFPDSDDAATAAFQLGREADDAGAVTWFRTYLRERPNGSLAREANGRLLEALSRSGDRASAERAATAYLASYPNGPHAAFARLLLHR